MFLTVTLFTVSFNSLNANSWLTALQNTSSTFLQGCQDHKALILKTLSVGVVAAVSAAGTLFVMRTIAKHNNAVEAFNNYLQADLKKQLAWPGDKSLWDTENSRAFTKLFIALNQYKPQEPGCYSRKLNEINTAKKEYVQAPTQQSYNQLRQKVAALCNEIGLDVSEIVIPLLHALDKNN